MMTEHWSFVDGLLARIEGPLNFRLILQPFVAQDVLHPDPGTQA